MATKKSQKSNLEIMIAQEREKVTRRDFLQKVGLGSLMASTIGLSACGGGGSSSSTGTSADTQPSVLVLGAGAAGLTAALALKSKGIKLPCLNIKIGLAGVYGLKNC